jgi:hypothetical protein
MSFTCPHCHQPLEVTDQEAGRAVTCPACQQTCDIPSAAAEPPEATPTAKTQNEGRPLPAAKRKQTVQDYRVRGVGGGGFKFLLYLALLVTGIVAVAMYRYHESPRQVLNWVADFVHGQLHPSPVPLASRPVPRLPASTSLTTPSPATETLPAPPKPPPEPDPLTWMIEHKEHWPQAVTLKVDTVFPILANGKAAGAGNVPAGSQLQIVAIAPPNVTLASQLYGGGSTSYTPPKLPRWRPRLRQFERHRPR